MARTSPETSVTYRFMVGLTDSFKPGDAYGLLTRDEVREVLDSVLYEGDKHTAYSLDAVDEEAHERNGRGHQDGEQVAARPSQATSVTHQFTVELTDYLEWWSGARLMTRDEARDTLEHALRTSSFTLRLVEEEAHDG